MKMGKSSRKIRKMVAMIRYSSTHDTHTHRETLIYTHTSGAIGGVMGRKKMSDKFSNKVNKQRERERERERESWKGLLQNNRSTHTHDETKMLGGQ